MQFTTDQLHLLEILSDGHPKSYAAISREFGLVLSPMSPKWTNKLAKPLKRSKLVRKTLRGGYRITAKGKNTLAMVHS